MGDPIRILKHELDGIEEKVDALESSLNSQDYEESKELKDEIKTRWASYNSKMKKILKIISESGAEIHVSSTNGDSTPLEKIRGKIKEEKIKTRFIAWFYSRTKLVDILLIQIIPSWGEQ